MEEKSSATLERIQQAAMEEFLDKGFLGASLRQIVKNAGVTTGAFLCPLDGGLYLRTPQANQTASDEGGRHQL